MSSPTIPPTPFAPTEVFSRLTSIESLTPDFLKSNYLVGLNFVDECGKEYPDSWYNQKIASAISNFEHYTNLTLLPRDIEDELHDYYVKDYQHFAYLQLFHYPIIVTSSTPEVSAKYPTGQVVTTFPSEWVRVDAQHGQLQLVPTQGTLSQVILGQGGSYLPIIYQGMGYLPQLFHVKYRAGFEKGTIPQIFLDSIAKLATIELMASVADAILPAGITSQSLGIDGLSESRSFMQNGQLAPVFSGRISQYKKELFGDPSIGKQGLFDEIKSFYRGLNMFVTA